MARKATDSKLKIKVKKSGKSMSKEVNKCIKKQYLKSRPSCKVTLTLPKDAVQEARNVSVVGDFNGWDPASTPMKPLKNGNFTVLIELPKDKQYRFRYLIDGSRWENDWAADSYVPNPYGGDDSVIVV